MNPRTRIMLIAAAASFSSPRIAAEEMLRSGGKRDAERDDKEAAIVAIQFAIDEARKEAGIL